MSVPRVWRARWGLALFAHALVVGAGDAAFAADAPVPGRTSRNPEQMLQADASAHALPSGVRLAACTALAQAPWPRNAQERRELLQRMESVREHCMDNPPFLANLGGNWLEEGNPVQALLWLERSLLLDPRQLGAQADYALALAATGERAALDELLKAWGARTDIPPLLMSRLLAADPQLALQQPVPEPANGGAQRKWQQTRGVSIVFGHESNLDRSPRLSDLTITPPDGPIELPLNEPLTPRPGSAATVEASWQAAFSPLAGAVAQGGLQASARTAPGNADTDWHHLQLAASISQRWRSWRAEMQGSATFVGGNLNEPYRLSRWGVSLESNGFGCSHRFALDIELRTQTVTSLADSRSTGGLWNTQCPVPGAPGWAVGAALRATTDVPDNEERAGGIQRQWSAGLRATGPLGSAGRIEVGIRFSRALDAEGYSPLLESNARRWLRPLQLDIEYSQPFPWFGLQGADLIAQVQALRQDSNLPVFRYSSVAVVGGFRWRW